MPLYLHWIALPAALVLAFVLARMVLLSARAKTPPPRRLSFDDRAGAPGDAGAHRFRLGRLTLTDAQDQNQQ